jgi:formate hydrogenlyase subunit 3/multisubunit Na+/H+ antiporter MnhD subunit
LTTAVVVSAWATAGGEPFAVAVGAFRPPLGISFYADSLALLFAAAVPVMSLLLWPAGRSTDDVHRQVLTLVLAAASSGLALAGDLFTLYVFYELAAVASYGLAADRGTAAGFAAAFRYLMISALGSVFALVGVAVVYFSTGTLNLAHLALLSDELSGPAGLAAFLFLLVGFGVKAELFPLNAWVPEVYGAASRRVAGLLAGLVSKLAVLVVVRLLVLVFPQEEARLVMLLLGILGVLAGELAAWRAKDLARMLAWSSIGQLGIVFIAFSLPGSAGIVAGVAVALHHLVAKPALFLLAERWGGSIEALRGGARVSPTGGALYVLFALSLVGLPPLPGFWAKLLTLTGLAAADSAVHMLAIAVVLLATIVEVSYLFRVAATLYSGEAAESRAGMHGRLDLATAGLFAVILVGSVAAIGPLWTGLGGLATTAGDVGLYVETVNQAGVTR